MYSQTYNEFFHQFAETDLDFQSEYDSAYNQSVHLADDQRIIEAISVILSEVLAEYARTKGKRKSGTWLRRIASVISKILKFK